VNPLGRAPRRPSVRRAQSSGPGKFNPFGIANVILVVLASFASRAAAIGTTVKSIDTGQYHTCALMDDGSLMCWGSNDDGKLGMLKLPNTYATSPVGPVNLGSGRTAKAVSLGDSHTCAILDDDALKCWGYNQRGQLGYGGTGDRRAPEATAVVNLGSGRTAKSVARGREHTCAILDDDTLKCWGGGYRTQQPDKFHLSPFDCCALGRRRDERFGQYGLNYMRHLNQWRVEMLGIEQ